MNSTYRLHYAPDNASLIIRLALLELRLPFDTMLVDRAARGHKAKNYLRLNPNGLIPVLETPDGPVFETGAILLWLADRHGKLAPNPDSAERAAFLKWLFFTSNTLHVAIRMTFYPDQYVGAEPDAQTILLTHMKREIARHLDKVESVLAERPQWLGGTEPTVLDFYICCLLRWLGLYPKGGTDWFHIENWPLLHELAAGHENSTVVEQACLVEGLGATPFTAPGYANPPEGSAT